MFCKTNLLVNDNPIPTHQKCRCIVYTSMITMIAILDTFLRGRLEYEILRKNLILTMIDPRK